MNKALRTHLFKAFKNGKKKETYTVTKGHRNSAIQQLIKLQQIRKYNLYTLYMSISIFDRYLASVGHWTLVENELDYLICVCCFIAAKIEQPKKPLFDNLILEYRSLTRKILRRDLLLIMERQVLVELGFDFNYSNPEHFVDRYLRILGYHFNKQVNKNAIQILTLHYIDETMQKYPVSKVAASSVILAINIYKLREKFIQSVNSPMINSNKVPS